MVQDSYNIIPVTLAIILHATIFGSLFVAFDLSQSTAPPMPLAIKATLVTDVTAAPPPVVKPPEPEVVKPDPDEAARKQAEEDKRLEDARMEKERLSRLERERKEAERKAARDKAERERKAARDKAERERKAEELAEIRRIKMEEERARDVERQREENRRLEALEEQRIRDEMIAAEEELQAVQNSTEAQVYQNMIIQRVRRNWARPGTARDDLECLVAVTQVPGGEVLSARVIKSKCNGDEIVQRSVEAAVRRASPLPQPSNPLLFLRTFEITFTMPD